MYDFTHNVCTRHTHIVTEHNAEAEACANAASERRKYLKSRIVEDVELRAFYRSEQKHKSRINGYNKKCVYGKLFT